MNEPSKSKSVIRNSRILSIIFWNTWFEAQCGWKGDGIKIAERLDDLITTHSPQILCLNEVYIDRQGNSKILDVLKKRGYVFRQAKIYEIKINIDVYNVIAYKNIPVLKIVDHSVKTKKKPSDRLYQDYMGKVSDMKFSFNEVEVQLVHLHLCALFPKDWGAHIQQRREYNKIISKIRSRNMIIGGDFNETKYMLPWLHLGGKSRRLTGGLFNPTWKLNPNGFSALIANYDHIVYPVNEDLRLHSFEILERQPSDHTPLLVKFDIA